MLGGAPKHPWTVEQRLGVSCGPRGTVWANGHIDVSGRHRCNQTLDCYVADANHHFGPQRRIAMNELRQHRRGEYQRCTDTHQPGGSVANVICSHIRSLHMAQDGLC